MDEHELKIQGKQKLHKQNEQVGSREPGPPWILLPLEQPLRRAPLTGALCRSALTRAFRPTFSFCMALRASLTEFTTLTMLIWLSDSSCNHTGHTQRGRRHADV